MSPCLRWSLGVAAIVGLAVAAHAAALPGGFVWEDREVIAENPHIVAVDGLWHFWSSTAQPDYWPLDYSLLWGEYRLWGAWPPGFRAVNLALHALNCVLVWRLLVRLVVPGAWLGAAVFAVHPVTVESVAWCIQSKTLLSTVLALASLSCFLRVEVDQAEQAGGPATHRWRWGWYGGSLALFVLALLAKSSVVMWPFVLLIVRWWQRRRLGVRDLAAAAPFFAASLALGLVAVWFQHHRAIGSAADLIRNDGFASRLALAGRAVWFYVGKAVWPFNLSLIYPRWPLGVSSTKDWLPDVALAAVFAVASLYRLRWGAAVLAVGSYFVVNLVPVLGVTNIGHMQFSLVADHWQYTALPGLLALLTGGAAFTARKFAMPLTATVPASAVLLAVLIGASATRASVYNGADNELLWKDVVDQDPASWVGQHELGRVYAQRGDYVSALRHTAEALRLKPDYGLAATNLGLQLLYLNRPDEAVDALRRAVMLEPDRPDPHFYLAHALLKSGQTQAGIEQYRANILRFRGDPRSAERLARTWATHPDERFRNGAEAVSVAEQLCAQMPPPSAALLDTLAAAYAETGRFDEAVSTARRALAQAQAEGDAVLAPAIAARLRLYQAGEPFRSPP